jgi:hypothetical protein
MSNAEKSNEAHKNSMEAWFEIQRVVIKECENNIEHATNKIEYHSKRRELELINLSLNLRRLEVEQKNYSDWLDYTNLNQIKNNKP